MEYRFDTASDTNLRRFFTKNRLKFMINEEEIMMSAKT